MVDDEVSYQYWTPVKSTEHYLYSTEIARALYLVTSSGKPARQFVNAWCSVYESQHEIAPMYYYGHELRRCFPYSTYSKLLDECERIGSEYFVTALNGRRFKARRSNANV
jgi:hypothetical protein